MKSLLSKIFYSRLFEDIRLKFHWLAFMKGQEFAEKKREIEENKSKRYKTLHQYSGTDFEVCEFVKDEEKQYQLWIEGYIGFKDIESFINLYKDFLDSFEKYLNENKYDRTKISIWKKVYSTRAIEICYQNDHYFIFLDGYKSTDIWDLYDYMMDVIEQLEDVIENNKIK